MKTFEYMNISFVHAESPVWDSQTKTLYWVDALQQEVHSMQFDTKQHQMKKIGTFRNKLDTNAPYLTRTFCE